jgi:DegV family protein with EDD domain
MVKIITDTTACLAPEMARRYGIPVIPQIITFGDESFYEGVDLSSDEFMQRLQSSKELPKTAAPPPELFARQFEALAAGGESILCIHPSAEVSGTVRSATTAALDFPAVDIRVIDTRTAGSGNGTMVMRAAQWAEDGLSADEIERKLAKLIQCCRVYFLVATLEYLARGGRIGGATALLGSVLQIKPILTITSGQVDVYQRERTQKRAYGRLKEIVIEQAAPGNSSYLSVMHAGVPEQGKGLADELAALTGLELVPIFNVPPAIVVHAGPGILGVAFFMGE